MGELKLLKCPFCSGEPQIETYDCKYSVKEYWIYCCSCDCASSRYYSKETAIEKWNTRTPMDNIVEKLEEELKLTREAQTIECIGNNGNGTPLQSKFSGEICALIKAINIVKQEINNGLE